MIQTHTLQEVVDAGLAPSVRWLQIRLRTNEIPGLRIPRRGRRGGWPEWRMTDAHVDALVAYLSNDYHETPPQTPPQTTPAAPPRLRLTEASMRRRVS